MAVHIARMGRVYCRRRARGGGAACCRPVACGIFAMAAGKWNAFSSGELQRLAPPQAFQSPLIWYTALRSGCSRFSPVGMGVGAADGAAVGAAEGASVATRLLRAAPHEPRPGMAYWSMHTWTARSAVPGTELAHSGG